MVVDFRPILISFSVLLLILSVALVFYKRNRKLGVIVIVISSIFTILSAKFVWDIGIIADENNLSGDPISFVLFIFILGLTTLNFIVISFGNKRALKDILIK